MKTDLGAWCREKPGANRDEVELNPPKSQSRVCLTWVAHSSLNPISKTFLFSLRMHIIAWTTENQKLILLQSKVGFPCPSLCIRHIHWWQVHDHECMALVRQTARKKVKTYNGNLGWLYCLQVDDGRALTWMKKSKGRGYSYSENENKWYNAGLCTPTIREESLEGKKSIFWKGNSILQIFFWAGWCWKLSSLLTSLLDLNKALKMSSSKIRWQKPRCQSFRCPVILLWSPTAIKGRRKMCVVGLECCTCTCMQHFIAWCVQTLELVTSESLWTG